MSKVTLYQAAEMAGITKQAIRKAISAGKLTSEKDEQGRVIVHAGDVERIWPRKPVGGERLPEVGGSYTNQSAQVTSGLQAQIEAIQEQLRRADEMHERERELLNAQIEDLRVDRDNWRKQAERTTLLLDDQRQKVEAPKRSWWARLTGS